MSHAVRLLAGLAVIGACTAEPGPTENSTASLTRDVPPVTSPAQLLMFEPEKNGQRHLVGVE